jgi:hypothetical protein
MQKVNGAESSQARSTPVAPGAAVTAGHEKLPPEILEKLKTPLPPEAVSPNPERPGLSVIKVIYVVERLNDVFGLNGWRVVNQVVESGRMVVVKATVTIPEYGIVVEQYGGNDNFDRGDAYKGACTDALSKCASYLGIGMDVYKGLRDDRLKAALDGCLPTSRATQPGARRAAVENARPEPTGLTTKNMVERFATMRRIIGTQDYEALLSANGYGDVTNMPSLEKARDVYRTLVNVFRSRYRDARVALGEAEYSKILRELRFSPKAKLSPEQAVLVFNFMTETMYGKQ